MRVLLLGANGQVGTECRRALTGAGELIAATRSGGGGDETADFEHPDSLAELIRRLVPDVVVNAAAYTAVDKAESERALALRINAEAVAIIANACAAQGTYLVHYSTDYVFDGQGERPYLPDQPSAPLGVYGESKLAGEQAIRASGCRHAILRTAWVYADHGKNFLLTMLRLAAERDQLRVVADQRGTPTPAALIADVTAKIVQAGQRRSGTWHLTALGDTTWHGFAEAIMQGAHQRGLIARIPDVRPIGSAEFPTPARRPAYSVLDTQSLRDDWSVALPSWQQGLDSVLDALAARG
ncbi:MAG: dTDP-4-dehydrorhamnose reductase [Pseudomonadota bacterium]|nr:dTDP-4-dehydrorhamnose reductase [Pseudomonadota bacterium]